MDFVPCKHLYTNQYNPQVVEDYIDLDQEALSQNNVDTSPSSKIYYCM